MLIPKCCKGCINRHKGNCCCSLPDTCNEFVEDNYPDYPSYQINYNGIGITPTSAPYNLGNIIYVPIKDNTTVINEDKSVTNPTKEIKKEGK